MQKHGQAEAKLEEHVLNGASDLLIEVFGDLGFMRDRRSVSLHYPVLPLWKWN